MIDKLISAYKRLLRSTSLEHKRYIYGEFNIENRLTGLIGPRGTGKTTLLLQFIQEKIKNLDTCIYVSIDNIYFSQNLLTDFVHELYENYEIRYFFFDEIHKYSNWNQELKNIYDSYPDIKIVFSGSSCIDLIKGTYDLSRRGVIFRMAGMSFREYLLFNHIADIPSITFRALISNRGEIEDKLSKVPAILKHFKAYLREGYYPFFLEDRKTYHQKILRVIEKTIYEDISNYYNLKTENLTHFKRILSYLATIPPGKLSHNNIAKNIGLDNKTIQHYLHILQETGLVELVSENRAGSTILKQTEKIYLDNPDLYETIVTEIGHESQIGTIREIFFIKMLKNSDHTIHYSRIGDFEVHDLIFEIGGKAKTKKQIKNHLDTAYLVKDDIRNSSKYEIPLHLFGFLY